MIEEQTAQGSSNLQPSTFNLQPSRQRGMALVITLILLSVTLIMAVAFLAISRRERGSVVTSTDTATARLAADTALANAEAQIISSVLATTNPYINNLLVSTNYINGLGFTAGSGNPTNVSYAYANGNPLNTVQDFEQNIANLYYLPRAPVFVPTNNFGSNEFRFYLDANRNAKFEDSGSVTNLDNTGAGLGSTTFQMGDPQWIGVLERPDAQHGPNNKFLSRYAFVALPADSTLDLNYIHNQSLNQNLSAADGYFRNQGGGSWEINLAGFLADLNTNEWGQVIGTPANGNATYYYYQYNPNNAGTSFDDARALLAWRYNYIALPLLSVLLPNYPLSGPIDIFPFGFPLGTAMTGTTVPFYNYSLNNSWPGADNTNHYFALSSDLFDTTKTERGVTAPALGFTDHLLQAGNGTSTYDRYTFYRLLSQLGTDSSPDAGRMNLNYDNLDPFLNGFYNTNGVASLTNFAAWTPLAFFTNAADRMLRMYTTNWFQSDPSNYLATFYGIHIQYTYTNNIGVFTNDPSGNGLLSQLGVPNILGMTGDGVPAFGLTNIPVSINGHFGYSSAVQRVLQLAANIYDATSTNFYPSRFRPMFTKTNFVIQPGVTVTNIYISGYVQQVNYIFAGSEFLTPDLATPMNVPELPFGQNILTNVYGVPWIIGAKKGFPNFNEFTMENAIQVTRKLNFNRNTNTIPASNYTTNQMYSMIITNYYGLECWNSYFNTNNYTGPTGKNGQIVIMVRNVMSMTLTNAIQFPIQAATPLFPQTVQTTNYLTYTLNNWPSNLFVVPLITNAAFFSFTNPVFVYKYNQFGTTSNFLDPGIYPLPQFGFTVSNHLQVAIIDYSALAGKGGRGSLGQIVDYVELGPLSGSRDINAEIADADTIKYPDGGTTGLWSTNLGTASPSTLPQGVINQYYTSRKDGTVPSIDQGEGKWSQAQVPGLPPGISTSIQAEQIYFTAFFSARNTANYIYGGYDLTVTNLSASMQAPYTPTRTRVQRLTWQANDPLVHYLARDLVDLADDTNAQHVVDWPYNLGSLNNRYMPWGGNPNNPPNPNTPDNPVTANAKNMWMKDPLVTSAEHWDFPTNKFPTLGWLGRVHRGTPWQTVYLKAANLMGLIQVSSNTVPPATNYIGRTYWKSWTGNNNTADAINEGPVQDRLLFDVFSTAINDNASRGRLSVNVAANADDPAAGLAAWSALFSGIAVPTNTTGGYTIIQPAGTAGLNSPLGQLVQGINNARTNFVTPGGLKGVFNHVGDILSVRALTEQSPFLAPFLNSPLTNSFNDEMYEWLPQQTLSLLRASGDPRYVIYCYGQTLRPAPNGVVTSGGQNYFGMVTNYQVVAETATRAVVQFKRVVVTNSLSPLVLQTNYSTTIEQFNQLPPD